MSMKPPDQVAARPTAGESYEGLMRLYCLHLAEIVHSRNREDRAKILRLTALIQAAARAPTADAAMLAFAVKSVKRVDK